MSDPVSRVLWELRRLGYEARSTGTDQWECQCPVHKGAKPNLAISRGENGRCLLHCFHVGDSGECTTERIAGALGLTIRDLFQEDYGREFRPPSGRNSAPKKAKTVHPTIERAAEAIAWSMRQARDGQKPDSSWRPVKHWAYKDANGVETFAVVRFQNGSYGNGATKAGKTYRPVHRNGAGWVVGDPIGKLPLYELPKISHAERVFVVEGEKCAEIVAGLDLAATTPAHGAKSPRRTDWSPLAGKEVVILPDADAAGESFAGEVVDLLHRLTPRPTVRVVRLPGLEQGGDVEQWLQTKQRDAGGDPAWRDEARRELLALTTSAPLAGRLGTGGEPAAETFLPNVELADEPRWAPGTMVKARDRDNFGRIVEDHGTTATVHFVSPNGHEASPTLDKHLLESLRETPPALAWEGNPEPIASKLLPVPTLGEELIPEPLRPWLVDVAERVGCSVEFPVVGALLAAAVLAGRKVGIRPKRQDDWLVVPNLWGGIVGRPGVMKTPALNEALRPLRAIEAEANARFKAATAEFEATSLVRKIQADVARDELKKALRAKGGASPTEIDALVRQASDSGDGPDPILKRYVVNDSTVEKMGELLRENPMGLMIFRDELTGWFRNLDKAGHESDRAFYLEAWNGGSASFTFDRIGRGTVVIPSPCVSIAGGIQPGPLQVYLKTVTAGGDADDGLISRFQLLVYPNPPASWNNVDRWPDGSSRDRADAIYRGLDALDPLAIGAIVDREGETPYLRFDDPAQEFFNEWRADLENNKLRAEGETPIVESHLAKFRSLLPSLALLFHLIESIDGAQGGAVGIEPVRLAAAWCDFLEAHARRIYSAGDDPANESTRSLGEKIKRGEVASPFTARDIYRKGWSGLSSAEEVNRAIGVLEGLNWVRSIETAGTGGAPRTDVYIHPTLIPSEASR